MILIKTTIIEDRPLDVTVRAWPKMKTAANHKVGAYWRQYFFPKHFEYNAKNKYGHQQRSRGYLIKKQRMAAKGKAVAPGTVDNVFTGEMKRALMSSVSIRSYPTRATVKMTGPNYALMRPYKSGQPNKGAELTAVTPEELHKLQQVMHDELERQLNTFRARRKTEI